MDNIAEAAWDESKVTSKVEVICQAKFEGKKVHFATLMDLCHFKKSELEKVREVLRMSCIER